MQDFRNLEVWRESYEIVLRIYELTKDYPKDERYGLTSQTRRAAVSVAANIAEGCGRQSDADFARFLHHALGSESELDCQIMMAHDLGLMREAPESILKTVSSHKRRVNALLQRVRIGSRSPSSSQ